MMDGGRDAGSDADGGTARNDRGDAASASAGSAADAGDSGRDAGSRKGADAGSSSDAGADPLRQRIRVLLTFDDGPEVTSKFTEMVLGVLQRKAIKAAFFVQARVPSRGGSDIGLATIRHTYEAGHVIAIHTGSIENHIPHTCRVNESAEGGLGDNRLESDLTKARTRLETIGSEIKYVRPPYGEGNPKVRAVYEKCGLTSVTWNVDSCDWQTNVAKEVTSSIEQSLKDACRAHQWSCCFMTSRRLRPRILATSSTMSLAPRSVRALPLTSQQAARTSLRQWRTFRRGTKASGTTSNRQRKEQRSSVTDSTRAGHRYEAASPPEGR
jgi:peptidoglycan/xylan/chitin deacetylase (PgdA/CDA1 family)